MKQTTLLKIVIVIIGMAIIVIGGIIIVDTIQYQEDLKHQTEDVEPTEEIVTAEETSSTEDLVGYNFSNYSVGDVSLEDYIIERMEYAYYEGQKDALNNNIHIIQNTEGIYIWESSPWDSGRDVIYDPIKERKTDFNLK